MSRLTKKIIEFCCSFSGRALTDCISSIFNKGETLNVQQKQNVQKIKNKQFYLLNYFMKFYPVVSGDLVGKLLSNILNA